MKFFLGISIFLCFLFSGVEPNQFFLQKTIKESNFIIADTSATLRNGIPETVFFYSPHPDDETLSMGAGILSQINKGNIVHVVLLTRGEGSGAITKINEKKAKRGADENTIKDFTDSRKKEFLSATDALGVHKTHIHNLPDGGIKKSDVKAIINNYKNNYSIDAHHTMSAQDPHPDHSATGQAVKSFDNAVFYIPVQKYEDMNYDRKIFVPDNKTSKLKNALNAYKLWDPSSGRYAVGWHSVSPYFDMAETYQKNKVY